MFRNSGLRFRLLIALLFALFAILRYCSSAERNPVTGEKQYVQLTPSQEIQLGLESAPDMAAEYGGLSTDSTATATVEKVGRRLVAHSEAEKSPYQFNFYLLYDSQTVNAFALPGGPVFITQGLYDRLNSEDQLAGVLGHEIAHVVARHSSEQIAKQQLTGGLTGAAVMASGDYYNSQYMAQMINQLVNMKFSRNDELQADNLGVKYMIEAGYNPKGMIQVMQILEQASGGRSTPEFQSTHPSPDHRIAEIEKAIEEYQNVASY